MMLACLWIPFLSMIIHFCRGQYPASHLEWDLMPVTGNDNVDLINGINLRKGGTLPALNGKGTWLEPTITELGWMFEGYNIAGAAPNANLNLGDTFGFHTWIYFTDITTTQTIWCKEWLQTEGVINMNSLRLCLRLDGGQFSILYNPSDAATHVSNENLGDAYNYNYIKLDTPAKFGWTYLAVNFKTNAATNMADVWSYMANHDQGKHVSQTYSLEGPIVDDNKFVFCFGAMAHISETTYNYELTEPLLALVNSIVFVKGEVIERWNAFDAFGFQCHDECQICRYIDQPKCLEDYETHVSHYWDFSPFRWYRPIWDYGNQAATIGLGIVMTGQGLFTHHNGMWFDGGRSVSAAATLWQWYSFSIDAWFKFYNAAGGNIIRTTNGNPVSYILGTTAPNTFFFTLNGQTVTTTFTYTAATDRNKWFIIQASVARVSLTESNVGIKMNDEAMFGTVVTAVFDPVTGNRVITQMIGDGLNGYIRKIKIYDYPKTEPSMELMYKTSPQCYKFHHTQADGDFGDIDYNFTCYTGCSEWNEWDYDCKACHAKCYTCSGNDQFHCFSGYETRYRFHERCTCCPETGGDGRFMGDSQYECDDGDNNVDDGGDGNGRKEAGFSGIDGDPNTATVCTEDGGDGRKINHAGDDGNTNNGDGGSAACAIEAGYQCTDGGRNTVDVCWEIGGDGLDYGNYGGDDGNTVDGDGGSSSCTVEVGWTCAGGTTATADTCTETCGDGFRTNHACDDGNTNNGDGCSSTCAVEAGWQCGHEAPSICWKITEPMIISTHIEGTLISMTFNESVILDTGYTPADIDFTLSGPLTPYELSWELLSSSVLMAPTPNRTIWFSFSSPSQFFGNGSETLTITFLDQTKIQNSAYGFETINITIPFTVHPQESEEGGGELIFQILIYFIMLGILAIGVLSLIAGHSMAIAWQALTVVQFANFIPFMMIYSPSCMAKFGEGLDVFNGKLFNRIESLSDETIVRNDFYNAINHKFIRAGYTSAAILYNASDLIIIMVILGIIILVFFTARYADRLGIRKMRNAIMFYFLLWTYMRWCFLAFINLRYATLYNWEQKTSLLIASMAACLVAGYPLYEAWNARRYYVEVTNGIRPTYFRLYILYGDFKVDNPLQYAYYWQYFLRRFLFIAMIVGWPQQEYLALSLSTIMHIMAMLYVTFLLPFNTRLQNAGAMISEAGLVAIHGTLFPLLKDDPNTGLSHYTQTAIVFFIAVLITICILAVLIVLDSFVHIKKIVRICRKEPKEDGPRKILDSLSSSDSLTEREVSLESEDEKKKVRYQLYDPEVNKEKFELEEKKRIEEARKKKGLRPKTPPKDGEALISQFGRPMFKDTQDIGGDADDEGSEGSRDESQQQINTADFMGQSAATLFNKPSTPLNLKPEEETKERLFKPREDTDEPQPSPFRNPDAPTPATPTPQNPNMTSTPIQGGFKSVTELNPSKFQK